MRTMNIYKRIVGGGKKLFYYIFLSYQFKEYHLTDAILSPISITPKYIKMGKHVLIFYHARINGVSQYNKTKYTPLIELKDGVRIQQNLHLTCADSIVIGENTAIAANVTITDIHHPYTDINLPIEQQDLEVNPVKIGKDCKIYNNAVILPGTVIGDHVTIGANSVVKSVIPDYCVAVGIPASIIKRYDFSVGQWRKTDKKGNFI